MAPNKAFDPIAPPVDALNNAAVDHFLQERRVAGEHHLVEVCAQRFDHAEDFCLVVTWRHEREGIALLRQIRLPPPPTLRPHL